MTKIKTRKSIIKRFKITKNGKIFRNRSFTSHLRVKRSQKNKKMLKKPIELKGFYAKKIRKALGIKKIKSKKKETK